MLGSQPRLVTFSHRTRYLATAVTPRNVRGGKASHCMRTGAEGKHRPLMEDFSRRAGGVGAAQ